MATSPLNDRGASPFKIDDRVWYSDPDQDPDWTNCEAIVWAVRKGRRGYRYGIEFPNGNGVGDVGHESLSPLGERAPCRFRDRRCLACEHQGCSSCPECSPEVPDLGD